MRMARLPVGRNNVPDELVVRQKTIDWPGYESFLRVFLGSRCIGFTVNLLNSRLKSNVLFEKGQWNLSCWAVTLFRNNQFRFARYCLLNFLARLVIFETEKQSNDVCVLLNRSAVSEVD
jgi:hypothetical protein